MYIGKQKLASILDLENFSIIRSSIESRTENNIEKNTDIDKEDDYININGRENLHNIIYPICKTDALNLLSTDNDFLNTSEGVSSTEIFEVFGDITKFGPMKLNDALPIIYDAMDDSKFYGCIIVEENNPSIKINITHPNILFELIECLKTGSIGNENFIYYIYRTNEELNSNVYIKNNFKVKFEKIIGINKKNIYRMKNESRIEYIQNTFDYEGFETSSSVMITSTAILDRFMDADMDMNHYRLHKEETEMILDNDEESSIRDFQFLVPMHILNNGLAYPFYGVAELKYQVDRATPKGRNLFPMASANIGLDSYTIDDISFDSVCTGSEDETKISGIRTISQSNLSSPMCKNVIREHYQENIVAALELSKEMLIEYLDIDDNFDFTLTESDFNSFSEYKKYLFEKTINRFNQGE